MFERDQRYRKKVMEVMNKQRNDFDTIEEFDEYLEQIENMIESLIKASQVAE